MADIIYFTSNIPPDDFHLPSIDDAPYIYLIIEIARYMSTQECRRAFRDVMPKYKAVYELIMAERVSTAVRRSMNFALVPSSIQEGRENRRNKKKLFRPYVLVKDSKDLLTLFGGSFIQFIESILPNPNRIGKDEWNEYGKRRLQEAWVGKESLYSIHGDDGEEISSKEFLDVLDHSDELWHSWRVKDFRCWVPKLQADLHNLFCSMLSCPASVLINILKRPGSGPLVTYISQDRKLLVTCNKSIFSPCYYCIGVRSRSKQILGIIQDIMAARHIPCIIEEDFFEV